MRILVVDDEPPARRRLVRMLDEIAGITVLGEANNADAALAQMREQRPDLVLLDIRMPGLSGLEFAASVDDMPPVVFTTAYNQYAVEAFEVSAVDYLLKPITRERLEAALDKARSRASASAAPCSADPERTERTEKIAALLEQLDRMSRNNQPYRLQTRSGNATRFFDAHDVTRIFATGRYAAIVHEGCEFLLDDSLQSLEKELSLIGFFRVHRSELVNLRHVRALRTESGATQVELSDGQTAKVSRRTVAELKQRLGIR